MLRSGSDQHPQLLDCIEIRAFGAISVDAVYSHKPTDDHHPTQHHQDADEHAGKRLTFRAIHDQATKPVMTVMTQQHLSAAVSYRKPMAFSISASETCAISVLLRSVITSP
jgi:hypothetical protein